MITLNFLVIVLCNEFVRGDKQGSVQNHKSKCRVRRKVQSWIWSLNLSFKKREEKKVSICVISKSFLCRGKHTQILESVITCQKLVKNIKTQHLFHLPRVGKEYCISFQKVIYQFLAIKMLLKAVMTLVGLYDLVEDFLKEVDGSKSRSLSMIVF